MAKDALYEDHPQYKEGMAALREAIKDAATLPNWDAACARTQEWAVKYKDAGGDDSAPRNYFFDMLEAFFPDDHPDFWDALEFWNKRYAIEDTDGDK